ncbi:MAG: hypothetical protein IPG44_15090 [Anaerolineales bacterium]|nr:hypothetical protein [Anaerolineales bacterium]
MPLEEGWKEEKTVCWYEAGQRYGSAELRAVNLNYYTSLEEASVFGELVWATGLHHRVDQAAELVFVCDAATWIWKIIEHYSRMPSRLSIGIMPRQRLHAVSETLAEQERAPWLEHIKAALWEGEVQKSSKYFKRRSTGIPLLNSSKVPSLITRIIKPAWLMPISKAGLFYWQRHSRKRLQADCFFTLETPRSALD